MQGYTVNTTYIVPDSADGKFRVWARKYMLPALSRAGLTGIVAARLLVETQPHQRNYAVRFDTDTLVLAESTIDIALDSVWKQLPPEILHFTTIMEHLWTPGSRTTTE